MHVQLIFNPASGRYSAALVEDLAAAFAACGATVTRAASGSTPPMIDEFADHVVVIGGDGTVRHVAHAIARFDAPPRLSVFPGGTVNLLAREWGKTGSVRAFAERVMRREERSRFPVEWDAGSFLSCAGAGWESVAVATVSPRLKRILGRFAYAVAALRSLVAWQPPAITLVADERVIDCEGFHIAKGVHYAGRYRLTNRMIAHEPMMQVVVLRRAWRRDLLRCWWTLVTGGSVTELAGVEVVGCRQLHASAGRALPVQADGDLIGVLPITFQVSQRAITTC